MPNELEDRLRKARLFDAQTGEWAKAAKEKGLFIDLSRVEWLDLGSLVQLVLLIESSLRESVTVRLALPLARPRRSEKEWMETSGLKQAVEATRYRVDKRIAVRSYMEHLRLVEILRAPHILSMPGRLEILPNFDSSDIRLDEEILDPLEIGSPPQLDERYRNIFPLAWFSIEESKTIKSLAWALANTIGVPERGLETIDAAAIANVILYELIENVKEHARSLGWALIAAWARPIGRPPRPEDYLDSEKPYIEWVRQRHVPMIELAVGDSGIGLGRVLKGSYSRTLATGMEISKDNARGEANVLLWAFDRWSTSKKASDQRGTRGLYRVDRVVRKYQGLVTLRSGKEFVGYDHGGANYDASFYHPVPLGFMPGTLLRIRMPAYREEFQPRQVLPSTPLHLELLDIDLGEIASEPLTLEARRRIIGAMRRNQGSLPTCVVVIFRGRLGDPQGVEKIIRDLAELRHPASLALLGLPGGTDLIENAVDSVNLECDKLRRSQEDQGRKRYKVWDPLLILSNSGQEMWGGATASTLKVLRALIETSTASIGREQISALLPNERERAEVIRNLRVDTSLVSLDDSGVLRLRVTARGIVREIGNLLVEHVSKMGEGVLRGPFRTPTLHAVRYWLDVGRILEATSLAPELVGLSVAVLLREAGVFLGGGSTHLITDSSITGDRAEWLATYIGAEESQSIPSEAGTPGWYGIRMVPRGSQVVVHCDVLLSEEAARRCISQVLRDEATPVALTCIFDARGKKEDYELWGIRVPVVALAELNMLGINIQRIERLRAINPVTRMVEEDLITSSAQYEIPHPRLWALLSDKQALHFTHIRRPSGRHFTFYVDGRELAINRTVLQSYERVILSWFSESRSQFGKDKIDLCYPASEPRSDAPEKRIAEWLYHRHSEVFLVPRAIAREAAYGQWIFAARHEQRPRSDLVVTVDWGALTGKSLMQFVRLAAEGGARNILCIVCLSQLPPDEEAFFEGVSSLRVKSPAKGQIPLLGGAEESTIGHDAEITEVSVRIRFLSSLSLSAYEAHNCPICLQLMRISEEEFPTKLLEDFARDQKARLRYRGPDEARRDTPLDVDGRPLSPEAVIWMIAFRMRLDFALTSTNRRWVVNREIEDIRTTLLQNSDESIQQALWLMQFLSIESHWLRRPPLQFLGLRRLVADIALWISNNTEVDDLDRINSVVVLRTASKSIFAAQLIDLVTCALQSDRLLRQILYDVYTYSSRPYHQTLGVLRPLRSALRTLVERAGSGDLHVSRAILGTMENLLGRVERECARVEARSLSPSEAWSKLRRAFGRDYTERHESVVDRMANIVPWGELGQAIEKAVESNEQGTGTPDSFQKYVIRWISGLHENWLPCRNFLDWSVLPLLRPLRNVLQGLEVTRHLGEENSSRLLDLSFSRSLISEQAFSLLIDELSDNHYAILSRRKWELFRTEAEWFWRVMLCAGPDYGISLLIEMFSDCPSNIADLILRTQEDVVAKYPHVQTRFNWEEETAAKALVFANKRLVTDLIRQIYDNCSKHQYDEEKIVELEIQIVHKSGRIVVKFLNNNTSSDPVPGKGLEKLRRRLEGFDCELLASERTSEGWATYEVVASFMAWSE